MIVSPHESLAKSVSRSKPVIFANTPPTVSILDHIATSTTANTVYTIDLQDSNLRSFLSDIPAIIDSTGGKTNAKGLFLVESLSPNAMAFEYRITGARIEHTVLIKYDAYRKQMKISSTPTTNGILVHTALILICVFIPLSWSVLTGDSIGVEDGLILLGNCCLVLGIGWLITYLSMKATLTGVELLFRNNYGLIPLKS